MIGFLAALEVLGLGALAFRLARRARTAEATGGRLLGIAGLLAAQALVLQGVMLGLLPGLWREGHGSPPGLVWLTQAARAALLLPAFGLWYALTRADLPVAARRGLAAALLALAFGAGPLPLFALAALAWLTGRSTWSRELSGGRRFAVLVLGTVLLLLTSLLPFGVARHGAIGVQFAPFVEPWQAALIHGPAPGSLERELALARPLDRLVQALLDLFRVQLLVVVVRALTLPLRLYGSSLKRRFTVNYIFVRSIPSVLAFITLLVVGYLAFGMNRAARARSEFERTLARAAAAGAALLDRAPGATPAADALASARTWLAPDGARAHLVLRRWEGSPRREVAREASPGAPDTLLGIPPAGIRGGLVEDGRSLYLIARRVAPDSSRAVDVLVPLDSFYVAAVARTVGSRITLILDRGFSTDRSRVRFSPDRSTTGPVRVTSLDPVAPPRAGLFLGRTYLPLGDWSLGWQEGAEGAVALELHAIGPWTGFRRELPGWLFSNIVTIGLLLALTTLIGIVEGIAVRSGRGIMETIESEVATLREAVTRFGAGELSHRIPVRGQDELSVLAGSFNEMAANLERQRAELIGKERLEQDLEVARAIQSRFLPQRPPAVPGLAVAGISVPSREVGGDLFHYAELPGGRLAIALGDVSGKSVPAALIMSNVMSALRAETQHEREIEKSLERVNHLLTDQIEPGRFVTLFYGILDPGAGVMRYTSAGHNPVLHVTARGEASWLREGGLPLGVDAESRYGSAQVPVESGDVVVAYSDGVTEAEGPDQDGQPRMFGEERLADAVRSLRGGSVDQIVDGILAAVTDFAAGRPQADDITLVVVRRA